MTITPERRAYGLVRVSRLTNKLQRINDAYAARSHSGHPEDLKTRELLLKERNSTVRAIKRWLKELYA
jgi:hypothetical protein